MRVEGFTDNVGNADTDLKLLQERADAVMNRVVSLGVDAGRLSAKGFGADRAVANNSTSAGRQRNRRVEIVRLGA